MKNTLETSQFVLVFARNVKTHRHQLGLSQEELAERAGVHPTYIGMLERSEKNVTIYNIERIARALEIFPYQLLMSK